MGFVKGENMNFYKILNENECHRGFQYGTGLNIDPIPFQSKGSCVRGGIYFAREDILVFLNHGPWLRKVTLPSDARWVKDPEESPEKWRADRVILSEKEEITPAVIERLIEEGANVHADDNDALRWSSLKGHLGAVKVLLEHSADVHADEDDALQWASINGHLEVVKVLLEHGADVHAMDRKALENASYMGRIDIIELLLKYGADIHVGNESPLRHACLGRQTETIEFLIEQGADVKGLNKRDIVRMMKERGCKDTIKLLKSYKL